ncbi:hypothetical protein D9756_008382 [Leucocoprinus leucothites]|uniref:Uncharacterized protein n=1 Tax=Leucocoprinus leucothites TaxID=201217 RepID=A0A8H5CZZ7_9AGAR|nr:hypothetical protein D9756_008382 [Leucoagaricus leucothites]
MRRNPRKPHLLEKEVSESHFPGPQLAASIEHRSNPSLRSFSSARRGSSRECGQFSGECLELVGTKRRSRSISAFHRTFAPSTELQRWPATDIIGGLALIPVVDA